MIVCIAEKPSVASEIAKVLGAVKRHDGYFEGNGYQVTWTFGHLCCLKSPEEYRPEWKSWKMRYLPMLPNSYDVKIIDNAGVKKQFKIVKTLFKKATTIINCGDAGQEGELIQRWVQKLSGVKCHVKRLWISSLTEESIRQGFQSLQPQSKYDLLYQAGMARAQGDWLLGMNATRAYTIKYGGYKQVISIGRVQTPTLSMIVDRDIEIDTFVPKPYWIVSTVYKGVTFTSAEGKLATHEEGVAMLQKMSGKPFVVQDVQEKKGIEQPPQLYDLTSLQVDCNKKYSMSAEMTLKTIQSLYEKKLTTYPRVDTKYLTDDMFAKCPNILRKLSENFSYHRHCQSILCNSVRKTSRVFDSSKVTDHHAIIPTGVGNNTLTDNEIKVYDLICRRFIAALHKECLYSTTTVTGKAADIEFKATGRMVLESGWREVYACFVDDKADNGKLGEKVMPLFSKGEGGNHTPSLSKKMTTPPKRYNDASLLQAMETAGKYVEDENLKALMKENGIGRPSSRAGIIETLIKRGYITRNKKNLVSTEVGKNLARVIKSNLLKSPEMTGQWEKKLRDIEKGDYTVQSFMSELTVQIRNIINEISIETNNGSLIRK